MTSPPRSMPLLEQPDRVTEHINYWEPESHACTNHNYQRDFHLSTGRRERSPIAQSSGASSLTKDTFSFSAWSLSAFQSSRSLVLQPARERATHKHAATKSPCVVGDARCRDALTLPLVLNVLLTFAFHSPFLHFRSLCLAISAISTWISTISHPSLQNAK